jgi:hypothetical protein
LFSSFPLKAFIFTQVHPDWSQMQLTDSTYSYGDKGTINMRANHALAISAPTVRQATPGRLDTLAAMSCQAFFGKGEGRAARHIVLLSPLFSP